MNEDTPSLDFAITADQAGQRLDAFLAEHIEGWSRSRLQRLIEDADVLVNSKPVKASHKLREGDEIDVDLVEAPAAEFEPEDIPLDVVFEDEYLAVINKPAGMVVHPGAGISSGTLANAIAWHFGRRGVETASVETFRIGIVHRLDKDTSGLIVIAKDDQTHEALGEQFRSRQVYKQYVALVHGTLRETLGRIDRPIARDRWHRTKMTVAANGRQAISLWKLRHRFEKFTLVEVEIKTGRTHQIRVHLASINHPVVGDATYNEGRDNTIADINVRNAVSSMNRFFLHAEKIAFVHPKTGEKVGFESELPGELSRLLESL
ncbi:MAG: RluA family pseudouridine synthase [Blastocatellia bacterium]|nr:RluA family pseudouridine synthase [Blastocatellia bacterium]